MGGVPTEVAPDELTRGAFDVVASYSASLSTVAAVRNVREALPVG